ncbi:MAG: DNA-binding response regulator [Bacteroidetes bacterium]|nr:MAG: DNA-binding response regulator [Bacteroidota bacterium]REK00023.1 MAG: DNA-binding response regulator [Bacteroidota bacterium]REK35797.1 MAG: DNA-binding response regulator [Bacteroidota bacterium]REK49331.1 MAG: DNA-binding response regulator [Bacteroidota bacterium]
MTSRNKILLVEDDPNFGSVLKNYLELNDYEVELCPDGMKGYEQFSSGKFDLCILDVMMPRKDGFSLARDIREKDKNIPIIFLTAKTMKDDMLSGFQAGADDYITKPFDSEVLLYKLKAVLKRSADKHHDSDQKEFDLGKFHFNYDHRTIKAGDSSQKLSPKEADLLRMLCIYKNELLPREKALKEIWGDDNYFNARSMDVFITKLRKYLKEDPSLDIINIHGKGFRLIDNAESMS